MTDPVDSSFINLDLELCSAEDLSPLAAHFGNRVFLLDCAETNGGFVLVAEPLIEGNLCADPLQCTDHLLALVESLPPALRAGWERCSSRRFDYGFDGGFEGRPYAVVLDVARVGRIAAIGVEIGMTLYGYSELPSEP